MKMELEAQLCATPKDDSDTFKCRECGCKYKNNFCSDEDIGVCRWCSGEEQ